MHSVHIMHFLGINQAGSSSAMQAFGHQKAMQFLLSTGLIITDRHATITKWMREVCPKTLGKPVIKHFFDLWDTGKNKIY